MATFTFITAVFALIVLSEVRIFKTKFNHIEYNRPHGTRPNGAVLGGKQIISVLFGIDFTRCVLNRSETRALQRYKRECRRVE